MAQEANNTPPTITLPPRHVDPSQRAALPPPAPFRFASWDDEEGRK